MGEQRKWPVNLVVVGFIVLFGGLLVAWGMLRALTGPELNIDLTERTTLPKATGADDQRLRFAVATMVSPENTFVSYRKLVELVGRKMGIDTVLVIRPSYRDVREELQNGTVDVAFVCTGTYAILADTGKVEMAATPAFSDGAQYRCSIIVAQDSPARTLKDLKGTSFAFTDPESCTGDFVPRCLFAEHGIELNSFFAKTIYTGSHDKSITAVANHVVTAAAIDHLVLETAELQPKVRVIWQSETFGPPPIVMPTNRNRELKERLRQVLLRLHEDPEAKPLLDDIGISKFNEPDPDAYANILEMYRKNGRSLPTSGEKE